MKDYRGIDFIKEYWSNNQYNDITCETDPDFDCDFFRAIGRLMDDFLIEKTSDGKKQPDTESNCNIPNVSSSVCGYHSNYECIFKLKDNRCCSLGDCDGKTN